MAVMLIVLGMAGITERRWAVSFRWGFGVLGGVSGCVPPPVLSWWSSRLCAVVLYWAVCLLVFGPFRWVLGSACGLFFVVILE